MVREIEVKDREQVEKISRLASKTPYGIWLSCGSIMLDARSLLGLFALVGKKVSVVAEDDVDVEVFGELVSKMA